MNTNYMTNVELVKYLLSSEHQKEEICIAAVKADYENLQYVKNQTEEICLAAVKK